jgi:TatD DNase family protein
LQQERDAGGEFAFLLHCFSSTRALAETAIAMGGYVSFSGILTFPRSNELREIARDLPAEHLLIETDAAYLAPVPFRGKRNEPAHVAHTHDSYITSRDTTTRSVSPAGLVLVPPLR